MLPKSKLRFFIFILISNAILFLPSIAGAQTPINCGQTLAGTISAAAERDSYSFDASANDRITIRARKTSGSLTPYLELYGPGGGLITSAANKIDWTLTQTGTYRIDVRDQNNTNTGDYLLYWEKMNNPCNAAASLACEQVVSGTIGTGVDPPPWRVYTFTASANDAVTIRARKTSGGTFIPYMELYGPTGSYVAGGYNAPLDRVLTSTGTYKILIRDFYNAYGGDFTLVWRKVSTPCSSTSISCAQALSGSVSGADEIDIYTFTASANDRVTIRTRRTSGNLTPYLELYGPSGSPATTPASQIDMTLSATGTYKILVRDQNNVNIGDYILYWQRLSNPCNATATSCGQVITGSIGTAVDPPPWRVYTFTASANDAVSIRTGTPTGGSFGSFLPYVELYDSTGSYMGGNYWQLDKTLTAAGSYTILLRDRDNTFSGNYALTWLRVSSPCNSTPIGCGQAIVGSLSVLGKIDVYTFTATSGDTVSLTLSKTSGSLDPLLELYNSSGTRIASYTGDPVTITQTLSTGGNYAVLVSDYGNDETGKYKVKFQKNNNSCPEVTVTAPNGGEIINPSSNYTITWISTSPQGINSQEIRLSTDGGQTFPNLIASGLQGGVQSYNWNVPADTSTTKGRIRVTATDGAGKSTPDDSDDDFIIHQRVPRTYVYDELNRLKQIIYEDGKIVNYTYDAAGNRITLTNE